MKQRARRQPKKRTVADYIKAVKKADREIEQSFRPGWSASTKVHTSKKVYNRLQQKRIEE